MKKGLIEGILISPLQIINVSGGDVFHCMKSSDNGCYGFGEAYFSTINSHSIKAWKRHRKMTLNLVVPVGAIRFIIYDDRPNSITHGFFQETVLSPEQYCRLTVPPMLWMGFQGISNKTSLLLNVANIEHQPDEVDREDIDKFNFDWEE